MAFDPTTVMRAVQTFLAASARFPAGVSVGAPNAPPGGMTAAVWFDGFEPSMEASGLAALSGTVTFTVRMYRPIANEPNETVEIEMSQAAFELLEDFCGDFDFGDSNVRNFDPNRTAIRAEEAEYKGVIYSIIDITVPLLVNDVASFVQ